jgi:hypothetical protein
LRPVLALHPIHSREASLTHTYDVEKGRRASVAFFVMMGYSSRRDNQNEAISVVECFGFSFLSILICVSSASYAAVNSADSNALNTNGSLTRSKEDKSGDGKYISVFLLSSNKLYRIKSTRFLPGLQILSAQTFQLCSLFLIVAPHSVSFSSLKELILSVQVRIFSFFPLHTLVKSAQGLEDVS